MCMDAYVSVSVSHVHTRLCRSKKGNKSPGTRVTGGCELCDKSSKTKPGSFAKAICVLNY